MNLEFVRDLAFAPIVQRYDIRDSALYALSLGMGQDPLDEDELPYVYEGRGGARWARRAPGRMSGISRRRPSSGRRSTAWRAAMKPIRT